MKILGIDTSTTSLGVAVAEDGNLLVSCDKIFGLRHSQDLIPTIKDLLKRLSLDIGGIDGFAVALGPGSFTGLRVGVTAAKALSLATKKPIIGVPTLDAIAYNAYYYPGVICPIMDAKKQLIYAALYKKKATGLKRVSKYLLIPLSKLLRKIDKKTLFIGDALTLYAKGIVRAKKKRAEFAPSRIWFPKAETIAMLGWEKLKKGKGDNPLDLVPLYLHSRECNVRK